MRHVLTWPSDYGPCCLQVPAGVFAETAAAHADGVGDVGAIRFPAPPRGRPNPVYPEPASVSWLCVLGLVVAAFFVVLAFQELGNLGDLARSESSAIPAMKTRLRPLV